MKKLCIKLKNEHKKKMKNFKKKSEIDILKKNDSKKYPEIKKKNSSLQNKLNKFFYFPEKGNLNVVVRNPDSKSRFLKTNNYFNISLKNKKQIKESLKKCKRTERKLKADYSSIKSISQKNSRHLRNTSNKIIILDYNPNKFKILKKLKLKLKNQKRSSNKLNFLKSQNFLVKKEENKIYLIYLAVKFLKKIFEVKIQKNKFQIWIKLLNLKKRKHLRLKSYMNSTKYDNEIPSFNINLENCFKYSENFEKYFQEQTNFPLNDSIKLDNKPKKPKKKIKINSVENKTKEFSFGEKRNFSASINKNYVRNEYFFEQKKQITNISNKINGKMNSKLNKIPIKLKPKLANLKEKLSKKMKKIAIKII